MMTHREIREKYNSMTNEEKTKLYIIAISKDWIKQFPHRPNVNNPDGNMQIDITPPSIYADKEEWEQLFILTQLTYKNYSFYDLMKSLKFHLK